MHSAGVAPCYHFACKQCWDQLLAAASGGGVQSVCPMCKAPVSRRSVQECEAYNAMTRELQKAIPAFGFGAFCLWLHVQVLACSFILAPHLSTRTRSHR